MEVRRLKMGLVGTTGGLRITDDNKDDHNKSNHVSSSQSTQSPPALPKPDSNYSPEKLFEKYERLKMVTLTNIPKLWPALEFALSVKSILNIKDCNLPFAGILLGPASSLKTVSIELFRGRNNTFYTDNFSAKAFVSHNSAVNKDKLKDIDMLPKIKDKFFLTPELAPTFAQREEELIQTLGIMTRILDGHGYESDTGSQGHRGYNEDIMFAWLGAAVDIPHKVHKQLSVLGPKLYFYRLSKSEETEDYYYDKRNDNFGEKKQAIQRALIEYLACFETNPQIIWDNNPKISLNHHKDEELAHRYIIRLARLLAHLRAVVPTWETRNTQGSEYAYSLANIEDPSRAITQLSNLARGHALSQGRDYIALADIPIIAHVVLSTASIERVTIFQLLISNNGNLSTQQIVGGLNTSKPTALKTMTELQAIGLVQMHGEEMEIYNSKSEIQLKPDYEWFLTNEFKELVGWCKEKCTPRQSYTCKEKCTPRLPPMPMLLYEYNKYIYKKLNLIRDCSSHATNTQYECPRGGQISLQQRSGGVEKSDRNDGVASTNINQRSENNAGHIHHLYEGSDIRLCEDCGRKGDRWDVEAHICKVYIRMKK
jgi:hypothetical protein